MLRLLQRQPRHAADSPAPRPFPFLPHAHPDRHLPVPDRRGAPSRTPGLPDGARTVATGGREGAQPHRDLSGLGAAAQLSVPARGTGRHGAGVRRGLRHLPCVTGAQPPLQWPPVRARPVQARPRIRTRRGAGVLAVSRRLWRPARRARGGRAVRRRRARFRPARARCRQPSPDPSGGAGRASPAGGQRGPGARRCRPLRRRPGTHPRHSQRLRCRPVPPRRPPGRARGAGPAAGRRGGALRGPAGAREGPARTAARHASPGRHPAAGAGGVRRRRPPVHRTRRDPGRRTRAAVAAGG